MRCILHVLLLASLLSHTACAYFRADPWHYMIRSDIITTPEIEQEVLKKARSGWTTDGRIRVIYLAGTPYERGYQQGVLLRDEIRANLGYFYRQAVRKFHFRELFDEAFDRARPYIPEEYMQEMRGLAHGSRLPLSTIHHIHILPEIAEWGGKKRLQKIMKQMIAGDFSTSCSNLSATGAATVDGRTYTVRVLDWGLHRISKLHQFPLIAVNRPDKGHAYVNIGWAGFLGAISGMNEEGITLGEMGYGSPPNESLSGKPMPFLLRDVLAYTSNLSEVRQIIESSVGTSSFVYLMSDGKTGEAEMYVRDRDRMLVFEPGTEISDGSDHYPAINNTVYGGKYADRMNKCLSDGHGKLSVELLMDSIIPEIAMPNNFQNVIYDPAALSFWVNNAASPEERAAEQPYTYFDFRQALREFETP
ncbi:MAG: hypothetical protein J5J00_12185 [Deltaproteobacteria bacterium]|nr:hypothetical protein [Deltaproteobacteria bacterium]